MIFLRIRCFFFSFFLSIHFVCFCLCSLCLWKQSLFRCRAAPIQIERWCYKMGIVVCSLVFLMHFSLFYVEIPSLLLFYSGSIDCGATFYHLDHFGVYFFYYLHSVCIALHSKRVFSQMSSEPVDFYSVCIGAYQRTIRCAAPKTKRIKKTN